MSGKILAISSGGGHWTQMLRLKPAFNGLDVAYVSVQPSYAEQVPQCRFYAVRDVNRWDRWGYFILIAQITRILMAERPRVVVTTGAAPGLVALVLSKLLLRSKTMWIDSIANSEKMSSSGTQARHFADAWLTQWPALQRPVGPSYWGSVL
jgi:UDP-N-acetylglucosamine:LPS N-acetylglucosamine transferase